MPIRWERLRAELMVQKLYRDLFDRDPERDVLRGLVGYLVEGRISARMQVMKMLKSEEFYDKRLRHKTPEDMARELYRHILAREPDPTEELQGAADFVGNLGWQGTGRCYDQQR